MNEENANTAANPTNGAQGTPTPEGKPVAQKKSVWRNPWLWGTLGAAGGICLGFLLKKRPKIITEAAPVVSDAAVQGLMAIL